MVPIYEPMSDRQKDYNALRGLSTTPKIVGYSADLGNGQFANYDANKNFLGNVSDNKGGFATQFLQNNGENLLNAGLLVGGAALLGGANLGSDFLSNIFGGSSTAADIAASDLAAYPTAGIVGSIPEAAGVANGIAATGAAAGALSSPVIPAATTLTGELGALAPAGTSLSEIGATAPGLTSATTSAGLTAPIATDAAGLTSGAGTQGLTASINPSLAANAPLAASVPAAAGMGGGTGLTAISSMGAAAGAPLTVAGASGLTVPAAGGGTVSAGGVTNPINNTTVSSGGINGVGTTTGTIDTTGSTTPSWVKSLTDATGLTGTQLAALLQGGIGAVNAGNISSAIGAGVDAQAAANAKSQDILKGVYDTTTGYYKPYQTAGTNAINALDAQQPYLTHQFDATDLQKGLAPNYDFMLQQGQMANQRAANVGGGALSGNTLQGLQNYTQNYAGNAYQNAFNNYQNQRNNIYNSLAGIANIGQTANTGAATAGANYGKGIVDLNTGLAGVRAAGMLGQAQAGASGATGVGNSVLLSTLLNQINPINPVKP